MCTHTNTHNRISIHISFGEKNMIYEFYNFSLPSFNFSLLSKEIYDDMPCNTATVTDTIMEINDVINSFLIPDYKHINLYIFSSPA